MTIAAGPPRVSRFGWSLAATKGRASNRDSAEAPAVLIATADPDLRGRWRSVLEGGYPVRDVSESSCLERTIATLSPDVLLLDLDLLGVGGIGDGPIIRALSRGTRVVLLSGSPNEREGIRVLKAGARGYCNKSVEPQLLRKIVDRIHDGEIWAERKLIPRLLEEYAAHPEDRPEGFSRPDGRLSLLTPREREVALLIGAGASNKEIASRLHVVEGTVKARLTAIFRKLGISDRLQLGLFLANHTSGATRRTVAAEGPAAPSRDRFSP
jgi:two-component system nitrate/nitrite response regulator NarL